MKIIDLNDSQLKQIYCAAMGWHSQLNVSSDEEDSVKIFDEFCDQIQYEWDNDRWTIWANIGQIEITEDLYFRCGLSFVHESKGEQYLI